MTKNVALVYSSKYIEYNFGTQHPLRPIRLELTYKMMESYGLLKNPNLTLIEPRMATDEELCLVHDKEYVEIVKKYSKNPNEFFSDYPSGAYGLGTMDDPVFPGMYEASALVSGATVVAAEQVINDTNNIDYAFNFGGGLHHANHNLAHGFCIFNDISVGIQKVRRNNPNMKIMYLDIDAHHGDGTQWIFYDDPNVLTLSIHQDGRTLFPGTGFLGETGKGDGENYSINFPIFPGTYDEVYIDMFDKLIPKIMEAYKPDLLVTQLGVDTHFMDPLTMLGLSTQGHEKIYKLIKKYVDKYCNEKWVALGGGGYLMTVVPRSWTMALAVMLGENIPNQIPMDWIDFCEKNLDDEEAPFELRDRNVRVEEQLIKNPMFPVRIEESIDRIEKFVENEILPKIKS